MENQLSHTEENYLKAIFKITERAEKVASTNKIAEQVNTSAASVTDMLKKLNDKALINYEKYKGATLTPEGIRLATQLVRKHRLWEVFLYDKLKFPWEQIHDIAEELEHINSDDLINRLDNFLGNPRFDPHGDPIPTSEGKFMLRNQSTLDSVPLHSKVVLVGVSHHSSEFLTYLNSINVKLGTKFKIIGKNSYDNSLTVDSNNNQLLITHEVAKNLLVKPG
jgi:DtxR family Mn-dependent transcriptional regulator